MATEEIDENEPLVPDNTSSDDEATKLNVGSCQEMQNSNDVVPKDFSFMFLYIAYAVGLGNIWRFPYLLNKADFPNTFLLLYFLLVPIFGIPLIILDFLFGTNFLLSSEKSNPTLKSIICGVRVSAAVISFTVSVYYQIVITWALLYAFSSFQTALPWSYCDNDTIIRTNTSFNECQRLGPVSYFWFRRILSISSDIGDNGSFVLLLIMCLVISWMYVYAMIYWKEKSLIKSHGKFPLIVTGIAMLMLIIYLGRAISLEGAFNRLAFMYSSNIKIDSFLRPRIWMDAISQLFYSHGVTFCGLVTVRFARYESSNHVKRKAICVGIWNCVPAILMGMIVFSALGYKSTLPYNRNESLVTERRGQLEQGREGAGVAFIAVSLLSETFGDTGPLFAVLMFGTIILVGVHGQSESIIGINNVLKSLGVMPKTVPGKEILCMVGCVAGMMFVQESGCYWLEMFDSVVGPVALLLIVAAECLTVAVLYGVKRFIRDFEIVSGKTGQWLCILKFLMSMVSLLLLIWYVIDFVKDRPYYKKLDEEEVLEHYPWYSVLVMVLAILVCVSPIFILFTLNTLGLYKPTVIQPRDETQHCEHADGKETAQSSPHCQIHSPVIVVGDNAHIQVGNDNQIIHYKPSSVPV